MKSRHGKVVFSCENCGFNTFLKFEIDRHEEYSCQKCNFCLPERVSFDIHMSLHTICESNECTFVAKSNEELGNHTKCKHSVKTDKKVTDKHAGNECDLCKESFETMLDLEWHNETEHEVPYL